MSSKRLADIVQLYRNAGRPALAGHDFHGELGYGGACELLKRLRAGGAAADGFRELRVDGTFVHDHEVLPDEGESVEFRFSTASHGGTRFFRSATELARYRPLGRGEFPSSFYLVDEDYLHGADETPPDTVARFREIARFVTALTELADHHYEAEGSGAWMLVFRTRDNLGAIETRFDVELGDVKVPTEAWDALATVGASADGMHAHEKSWMLRAALCKFLERSPSFAEFVKGGQAWASEYERNLHAYLSEFSFDEVKRKIATEHATFAERISKALSDISVKILGLPLSMAVASALKFSDVNLPEWVVLSLLLLAAWPIGRLVGHYRRLVPGIQEDINLVYGKLLDRGDELRPEQLAEDIARSRTSLEKETLKLRNSVWMCTAAVWAFPIVGAGLVYVV